MAKITIQNAYQTEKYKLLLCHGKVLESLGYGENLRYIIKSIGYLCKNGKIVRFH